MQAHPTAVSDVKVRTDRSIDCSSIAAIARDLYRDCATDEQKAVATWYFVRRMLFHWPHVPTWNSLDLINSYGWGLCGYQSRIFCQICRAGGIEARIVKASPHVVAEARYAGAWHLFDCQVGWYALRKDRAAVASAAEMKADHSIITDAVADGRASRPYFQCSNSPDYGVETVDIHQPGDAPEVPDDRLVISLRPGESITRRWSNEGKSWHPPGETQWVLPHHGCTANGVDENDPVNWPFWKPYAEVLSEQGGGAIYGVKRRFGNGRMVYEPDLAGGDAGQPLTLTVDCPYVMVDAWLDIEPGGEVAAVSARAGDREWREVHYAKPSNSGRQERISLSDAAWAAERYAVRIELRPGARAADLGTVRLTSVFMNNLYALPYLVPGANVIRIDAADAPHLDSHPLILDYTWEEAGQAKRVQEDIRRLPFEREVHVAGKGLPRMRHVTLSVHK